MVRRRKNSRACTVPKFGPLMVPTTQISSIDAPPSLCSQLISPNVESRTMLLSSFYTAKFLSLKVANIRMYKIKNRMAVKQRASNCVFSLSCSKRAPKNIPFIHFSDAIAVYTHDSTYTTISAQRVRYYLRRTYATLLMCTSFYCLDKNRVQHSQSYSTRCAHNGVVNSLPHDSPYFVHLMIFECMANNNFVKTSKHMHYSNKCNEMALSRTYI